MKGFRTYFPPRRISLSINLLIIGMLLCQVLFILPVQILSQKVLFGDGAFFFLQALSKQDFLKFDRSHILWPRQFAHYIGQLPLVLSIKLFKVQDIQTLLYVYGFTLHFIPIFAIIVAAFLLVRSQRLLLYMIFISFCYLSINNSLFTISEGHIGTAVFWIVLSILVTIRDDFSIEKKILLLIVSFLSLRLYESYLLLGILLAVIALLETISIRNQLRVSEIYFIYLCIIMFLASPVISVVSIINRHDPTGFNQLLPTLLYLKFIKNWVLAISTLIILLPFASMIILLKKNFQNKDLIYLLFSIAIICLCLVGIILTVLDYIFIPHKHFELRFLNMLVPGFVAFLVIINRNRFVQNLLNNKYLTKFAVTTMVILYIWNFAFQIHACYKWFDYKEDFIAELHKNSGIIDFKNTSLNKGSSRETFRRSYSWWWTFPAMSIIWGAISNDGNIQTMILNHEAEWQPFDPRNPSLLPDLSSYGVEYNYFTGQESVPDRSSTRIP